MSYSVINLDDFKNAKFDKTCLQFILVIFSLMVYFYCNFFLK